MALGDCERDCNSKKGEGKEIENSGKHKCELLWTFIIALQFSISFTLHKGLLPQNDRQDSITKRGEGVKLGVKGYCEGLLNYGW